MGSCDSLPIFQKASSTLISRYDGGRELIMNLRDFLRLLDELCPVPEGIEVCQIHEIEVAYELADPDPQLGWS
jgi:hypothetical protein